MNREQVPFLDFRPMHESIAAELKAVFDEAMRTSSFVGGPMVEGFEQSFAAACGTRFAVGVGSGTDALRFALLAAGVGPGDIVLTVPNTFIATTEAISQVGALPDFVDIDENTYTMSPAAVRLYFEQRCSPAGGKTIQVSSGRRVAALLPVHLYGQPADMDPLFDIADEYAVKIVEDACQAHGARYFSARRQAWLPAGSMGCAGAFSFYPGKNLGAFGEAGAVTTDDPQIAQAVSMLRDHGQSRKYVHQREGYNGRLDALQAGILSVKLAHLARWNAGRQECAARYTGLLSASPHVICPSQPLWADSVYHLYVVRVPNRDAVRAALQHAGIGTGLHYPLPLHLQDAYRSLNKPEGSYPAAELAAREILSLPMFPGLTANQQRSVAAAINECMAGLAALDPPTYETHHAHV